MANSAMAHDVSDSDKSFVRSVEQPAFMPFAYLGAKHMVTGYDHILFLVGVIFFLHRLRDVFIFVTMFSVGHTLTLLSFTMLGISANPFLVDAVIGLSVAYKGFDNVGGFEKLELSVNRKLAVFVFGLVHGMGLATKLTELGMSDKGLLLNLAAFNFGVEIGQMFALSFIVALFSIWRRRNSFVRTAVVANIALILAGLVLATFQIKRYLWS